MIVFWPWVIRTLNILGLGILGLSISCLGILGWNRFFHFAVINLFCLLNKFQFFGFLAEKQILSWSDIWFFVVTPPCSLPECFSEHYHDWPYSLIQEKLSLVRSEVLLDYGLANPFEKCSKPVRRNQSPFKVVVFVRCKLHLISFWWNSKTSFTSFVHMVVRPIWPLESTQDCLIDGIQLIF